MNENQLRKSYGKDWMNDIQWECWLFMGQLYGFNHLFGSVRPCSESGIYFIDSCPNDYSTFDYDDLTRLVISAHEEAIRVQVSPSSPGKLGFTISKWTRKGEFCDRHTTIEDAVKNFRKSKKRYNIEDSEL